MFYDIDEEQKECEQYLLKLGEDLGYTGKDCINCGRNRVIKYSSGKEICEKCNFDQNKKEYDWEYRKFI